MVYFQQILQKIKKKEQSFKRSDKSKPKPKGRIAFQYNFAELCDVRNPPSSNLEEYKEDLADRIKIVVQREGKLFGQARMIPNRGADGAKLSHNLERKKLYMTRFTKLDHPIDFPFLEVFMPPLLQPKELVSPDKQLGYVQYELRADIDLRSWF